MVPQMEVMLLEKPDQLTQILQTLLTHQQIMTEAMATLEELVIGMLEVYVQLVNGCMVLLMMHTTTKDTLEEI